MSHLPPIYNAIELATRAPSGHNAQPWLFCLDEGHQQVDLWADRRRRIPVIDREDRELTISCGAALLNLREALECLGCGPRLQLLPEPENPDLLARVSFAAPATQAVTPGSCDRVDAISLRFTHRPPFQPGGVDPDTLSLLQAAAQAEGSTLLALEGPERELAVRLVGEANARMSGESRHQTEMRNWLSTRHRADAQEEVEPADDPGHLTVLDDFASGLASLLFRFSDGFGSAASAKDQEMAQHAPLLLLLGTAGDEPSDWVRAGLALQRVLLEAAARDLQASYLNGPLEFPDTRLQMPSGGCHPQLLLRMGYASRRGRPTPRRSVQEVLITRVAAEQRARSESGAGKASPGTN